MQEEQIEVEEVGTVTEEVEEEEEDSEEGVGTGGYRKIYHFILFKEEC